MARQVLSVHLHITWSYVPEDKLGHVQRRKNLKYQSGVGLFASLALFSHVFATEILLVF
jgi:hypothetical protein